MRKIPELRGVMTPFPYSIDVESDIRTAKAMMEEHSIRHLPVKEGDAIVGILSERDLRVVDNIWSREASEITVGRICTREPYVVSHTARLDHVVQEMGIRGIGSVIVTKDDKLVGVLTTRDVCRLLSDTLREFFAPHSGHDAA